MTLGWLLVATLLRYTVPQLAAHGCEEATGIAAQVESVKVYGWPLASTQVRLLRAKEVRGRDGQPDTVWLDVQGAWTVYATATRRGRESCAGNLVGVGRWPLGVGPVPSARDTSLYDLQGRRVQRPLRPGVRVWRPQ